MKFILIVAFFGVVNGDNGTENGLGGLISGFLETLATPTKNQQVTNSSCPGSCTSPLTSIFLCDVILRDKFCPNDYSCCVSDEAEKEISVKDVLESDEEIMETCSGACISEKLKENCEKFDESPWCGSGLVCCHSKKKRECLGVCRSLIFGLFLCDEIDDGADCGDGKGCCIMKNGTTTTEKIQESEEIEVTTTTTTTIKPFLRPLIPRPKPIATPCPRYCLPLQISQYCRAPIQATCGLNAACCAHDLQPMTTTTTTTTTEDYSEEIETSSIATTVLPCPGQCIRPIMSFTCFLNAEMTDAFSCDGGKVCCAPKKGNGTIASTMATINIGSISTMSPIYRPAQVLKPQLDRTLTIPRYICGVKGKSRKKRVVGGSDSLPGEWCWHVALINSMNQYLCGGALIGVEWVLTAAHCVTNIVRSGASIYVRVGDHDLTSKFGSPGAQTLRVATTYIHHNHNSQTLDNDIALLKLSSAAVLKEGVCLVCLPSRGNSPLEAGRRCVVTGYGYMGEGGPIPLRVREATLPIVPDAECIRKINAVTEKPFVLPASSFCAGGESKNDACQGDGGGGLVCEEDDYFELTGLISWGFGCGRKDVPGVYVYVAKFIGWINQIISIGN